MTKRLHLALHALGVAAVLTLGLAATAAAEAHPRGRVHLGLWVGGPLWWGGWPYAYGYPYAPERTVVVQTPAEPVVVAPAQQSHTWYYCRDAQMYYPYVTTCASPWQEVPATPAPAVAPAAEPSAALAPAPAPATTTRTGFSARSPNTF